MKNDEKIEFEMIPATLRAVFSEQKKKKMKMKMKMKKR